jgi:YidC/Oxa1 family membrane protein insertase
MLASMEITSKNAEPQQRWLMRLMPIGASVFLARFPAGLFMYWITTNVVTLIQNYLIYNFGPGKKSSNTAAEQARANADEPKSKSSTLEERAAKPEDKTKGVSRKRKRKKRR